LLQRKTEAAMDKKPKAPSAPKKEKRTPKEIDPGRPSNRTNPDFRPKTDLPGKTDSGPEPDVFGREIPPQE
jgi:hypothetical protein